MSSRSFKSASTDIDATLALAIATSRQRETNIAICQRETNVTTRATVLGAPRSGGGRYLLTSPFLQSRFSVSLCARIAQSAIIAAARAMPVVTIGANSATVFQKAAFQRNSTAIIFDFLGMAMKKSPLGRIDHLIDRSAFC